MLLGGGGGADSGGGDDIIIVYRLTQWLQNYVMLQPVLIMIALLSVQPDSGVLFRCNVPF